MDRYPKTSAVALLGLVGSLARATVVPGGDRTKAIHKWLHRQTVRHGSADLVLNLGVKRVLLVGSPTLSAHILRPPPAAGGFVEGNLKKKAMYFLAPQALTISHGDEWRRRREFNEQVLQTGRPHDARAAHLEAVHRGFSRPVTSTADVRAAMGRVMLDAVFGPGAPHELVDDINDLIGVVQSPVRRLLLGRFKTKRRARFYETIGRLVQQAQPPSLVASARTLGGLDPEELVQQVPHWMFTFTGSGTDLLIRTLGTVGSRPAELDKLKDEIGKAGPLDDPETIGKLRYVEACLREAGRLFAPVTTTFHVAPEGDRFNSKLIPIGMEIVHYFPLQQRNIEGDASGDQFEPQRWWHPESDAWHLYPSPFLTGARECPGRDLILFACKAALALLIARGVRADAPSLATDPLPLSFPERQVRFKHDELARRRPRGRDASQPDIPRPG